MSLNEVRAVDQIGFPILSVLIVFPVLWAILVTLIEDEWLARRTALVGALAELLLAVFMAVSFTPGVSDIQFVERIGWIATMGVGYYVGVDGISVLFIPLTAFVTLIVMLFSWTTVRFRPKAYLAALFAVEATTIGIFASLDLVLFFVFWELILVPLYFLLRAWGIGPERQYAAVKYVMYMMSGSVPMLLGIVLLGVNHYNQTGAYSFDFLDLLKAPVPHALQTLIFFLLAFGLAVKAPLFPFHTWMPTVLLQGPIGAGMFLIGLKIGVYGFIRFVLPLVPDAVSDWSWLMAALGATAIMYGGLIALVQPNLRRLLAFASVSHVGLALVGVFSLNVQGIQGALLLMFHLGIVSTGLFLLTGLLYARTGSSELSAFGGIARHAPLLATFFFIIGLAAIGLPGTSGFPGEFLVLLGAFEAHWAWAAVAVVGVVLTAAYFLSYYERAFFGPPPTHERRVPDLHVREAALAAVLAVVVFWIGLFPARFLDMTSGSVRALVERMNVEPVPHRAAPGPRRPLGS